MPKPLRPRRPRPHSLLHRPPTPRRRRCCPWCSAQAFPCWSSICKPCDALDYEHTGTGEWLANCSVCCAPEIANAFARAGVRFRVVSACCTRTPPHGARSPIGAAPPTSPAPCAPAALAFSDIPTRACSTCTAISPWSPRRPESTSKVLEMCDLDQCVEQAAPPEVEAIVAVARSTFDMEDVPAADLAWAAQVAAGLDRLVDRFQLNGLTYYYRGLAGNRYERLGAGLILAIRCSPRAASPPPARRSEDLLAMTILHRMGAADPSPSSTPWIFASSLSSWATMAHASRHRRSRPVLRGLGLYHGKRGSGVSVEGRVKTGRSPCSP